MWPTILVGSILAVLVVLIIRGMLRDHKRGGCGCGCTGCCHGTEKPENNE